MCKKWVYCSNCKNLKANLDCIDESKYFEAMNNKEYCKNCKCYGCDCTSPEDSRPENERPNYIEEVEKL